VSLNRRNSELENKDLKTERHKLVEEIVKYGRTIKKNTSQLLHSR